MRGYFSLLVTVWMLGLVSSANAVGFQYFSIPDGSGRPIEIGVWYPSASPVAPTDAGGVVQTVAMDGAISGAKLPVVIFSHGSAGWFGDRSDTATAFAKAGLIAVALTYPGDNYKDSSDRAGRQMTGRPIVTSQVLDYLLEQWSGRDRIDKEKIGFYGFSAGGFTGLVEIGGIPDWALFAKHCKSNPDEGVCMQGVARYLSSPEAATMSPSVWHHDNRIKAAALASPGFGFAFSPASLAKIKIPVKLWGGERDKVVQFSTNVAYLASLLPNLAGVEEVAGAQHYSFLRPCSDRMKALKSDICSDAPGFDRAVFQAKFNEDLLRFFQTHLEHGKQ